MKLGLRSVLALVAACGAVLCFAIAGSYCAGCTPAEQAKLEAAVPTVEADVAKVLKGEQLVCLAASFVPGSARSAVIVGCEIAESATGAADSFLLSVEAKRHERPGDAGNGG